MENVNGDCLLEGVDGDGRSWRVLMEMVIIEGVDGDVHNWRVLMEMVIVGGC